ncbi:MAG: hypothetical protein LBC02_07220 [Planctomycetaceae bacterium]|nr:hypothetical protein [Planctomycetaceae bacterium]
MTAKDSDGEGERHVFRQYDAVTPLRSRLPCGGLRHCGRDVRVPTKKHLLPFKVSHQFYTKFINLAEGLDL